ncbi:4'-phosphopantetheinyl transferase superfamily protein [uncultured Algibacter sp.]|uniref:4'-phosphopantetheinyl transferase superfamily protein n=1 Tax=uncultured Algibacter sp. TaxID=298659 RepID=UPI0030EC77F0|tara:strand:+ start:642 stop:1211 length:570 start_codon:yes stop_codon:yes gene_type:complete
MIGIDIIDIAEAKRTSNWERPRFLEKLFTLNEQQLIHASKNPFIMVWRLWSMKEAAYKLYTQTHPERFYNPKQFQCEIIGVKLKVKYKDFQCFINTKITTQYILSEASLIENKITSKYLKLTFSDFNSQSKITKEALIAAVSDQLNILKSKLKISKSEFGIPSMYYNAKKLNIRISLSHHGNFGAYGFV